MRPKMIGTNEITAGRSVRKWRIDMKFLPVKFTLFCWYTAAYGTSAFLPVFLRHQGLTIVQLSIFTGISVCFQFLGGVVSAFIADKIGRVKPFWFFFLVIFCVACLSLTTLPSVTECNVEKASFECYSGENFYLNASSCKMNRNNSRSIMCSKITVDNGTNHGEQSNSSDMIVTLSPKFDVNLEMENRVNFSGVYSSASDCKNYSNENITLCTSKIIKSFHIDCAMHFLDCNKNAKFWIVIYGCLVILYGFSRSNVFRFNDIIVSDLTVEHNSDFGRQRLYGIGGIMVGPPLTGLISNAINGSSNNEKSYTCVFVCGIIFSVLAAFSMGLINPKFHKPASNMWKKSFQLVKNLDIMLFFALLISTGTISGFQLNYRNWYLKELGASDLLTGIVNGSVSVYGIPFLYYSSWCINKIGIRNVFALGLLGNVVCSFSYSAMEEPWIAVILESTTILSYHLFWVAAIQYSHLVAPEGLEALMQALTGSVHFSIGKLGSSLVAGYVMNIYGGRAAFTVLGCIASAYSFVYGSYLIIQHLKRRKITSVTETEIPGKNSNFS